MKTFHLLNLRAIAEPSAVPNNVAEVFSSSLKILVSNCILRIYVGGGGRFKPSFSRSFSCPAFSAFASVCRADGSGRQSLLFLVARSFLNIFQRTANANLYQGVSPPFPVLRFERGTMRPCACLRHRQTGQASDSNAQCVTWVFCGCIWLLCMHKTSDFRVM